MNQLPDIIRDFERVPSDLVRQASAFQPAILADVAGRRGALHGRIQALRHRMKLVGSALTVEVRPGDNLMIHAAIEQCQAGDVLVVTTTSPNRDGLFGDLFATALKARGVRGIVTTTAVRDVADLREMGFPAWSAAVFAQGSVKATGGSVNVPVVIDGAPVNPGDVVVADDDGVVIVPRDQVDAALAGADARVAKEDGDRAAYGSGEQLSLDRKGLRPLLDQLGVRYITQAEYDRG